jgi:hypothetical protein
VRVIINGTVVLSFASLQYSCTAINIKTTNNILNEMLESKVAQ